MYWWCEEIYCPIGCIALPNMNLEVQDWVKDQRALDRTGNSFPPKESEENLDQVFNRLNRQLVKIRTIAQVLI